MLRYKFEVLKKLREAGYTAYKMQKENILSNSTIQKLRRGEIVGGRNIDTLCRLLDCQPGDLIEYVSD